MSIKTLDARRLTLEKPNEKGFFKGSALMSQRPASSLQRLVSHVPRPTFYVKRLSFVAFRSSFVILFACSAAFANNLTISNVSLETRNASANTVVVEFDISWDHSWRTSNGEHDAAWVFVKLLDGNTGTPSYPWLHGKLYTAGTNPADGTSPGTNTNLEVVVPSDKIGAFIRRKVSGTGTVSSQNVRLVVDYGTAGAADTDTITARVFGIEMVYIPEGPFYIGGDNPDLNEIRGALYSSNDGIISVFDSSQTFQWSKRIGGSSNDSVVFVRTLSNNNLILTGTVTGNGDLNGDGDTSDTSEAGNTGVYGSVDIYVSTFDSAGSLQWSKRLGGTGSDIAVSIASFGAELIAAAGNVLGTADLNGDGDTADTNETGSAGVYNSNDAYISVFDSSGAFQWSERLGGTSFDLDGAVIFDADGNVIFTGMCTGNADLNGDGDTADTNETGETGVYSGQDIYISKFTSAGAFLWSKRLGGTSSDRDTTPSIDTADNIIISGNITGNADLNGDGDTADTFETGGGIFGGYDLFISVFDSTGAFQWAKRLGSTAPDTNGSIVVDSSDRIIIGAKVGGNGDLNGDGDTSDTNESGYGNADIFLSTFDSAGTFQWSERLGGVSTDDGIAVARDSSDNVYITGSVTSSVDLNGDGDTADSNEATSIYGSTDIFVSSFSSNGTFLWSERLGATPNDQGSGVAVDTSGNSVIVGYVNGNADLNGDAGITGLYSFYQNGFEDVSVQITTTATSITVDSNSSDDIDTSAIAVTGGSGIAGNTSWPEGYGDFYLMKYEISQQQYRDFLNTLSREQQSTRVGATVTGNTIANYYVMSNGTTVSGRQGIRAPASGNGTTPTPVVFGCDLNDNGTFNEADDGMNIAMNWMNWPDVVAYADWAGLRPATELEFEKAARGPSSATYAEYAWGSTITQASSISNSGRVNETAGNAGGGLAVYNSHASVAGPLRVGFAATSATNRKSSGAGYYGNMELSGNVQERAVTLGNSTGRAFTGTHGDGVLTTTTSFEGNATNNDWPGINATTARGVTLGTGGGWRGGGWADAASVLYVSDRNTATGSSTTRATGGGGRAARTAP